MSRDFERSLPAGESRRAASWLNRIHLDPTLLILVLALCSCGLVVMSSVSGADMTLFYDQLGRMAIGLGILVLAAQAPPSIYLRWAVGFYLLGIFLLILVIFFGVKVKGSQRWLDFFGLFRFQPSELVKITVPMGLAWYLQNKQIPLRSKHVWISLILVIFSRFINLCPARPRDEHSCRGGWSLGAFSCWHFLEMDHICFCNSLR